MTMAVAMAMSSILSATPTCYNSNNNRVFPVVRSASLKTLPLASTSRFPRDNSHGLHCDLKSLINPGLRPRKHIRAANDSAPPAPPTAPTGRKAWIAGIVITLLLPFLKSKWGPLLLFKDKFDTELRAVDDAVEAVEKVAEGVEKAAEDLAEKLPDGSRLKNAANVVEHAAEEVAKDAHLADAAIHKFQELEKKADAYVESHADKGSKTSDETKANVGQA